MGVKRTSPTASQVEVLDRVLDKGIVIDAWFRVAIVGLDLITIQSRIVVASIQTYLESAEAVALAGSASPPIDCVGVDVDQCPVCHSTRPRGQQECSYCHESDDEDEPRRTGKQGSQEP